MAELPVQFENKVDATGQDLRHAYERPLGEGVEGYSDMLVAPGAAATTVDVAAGIGFVRGDGLNDLGLYRCRNDATKGSAAFEAGGVAAPDATNPRLDQIIARVYDDDVDSEGQRKWRLAVLKGTPKAGDTLDKREGAAALPNSAMLLADVLVPAGAPAVLKAENIRDRRPFCYPIIPPLLTDVDMVPLLPLQPAIATGVAHSSDDAKQGAVPVCLPRRIAGGTRLRWTYQQGSEGVGGSGVAAGNYVLAIFDASGRKLIDTGSVGFGGGTNSRQSRSEAIGATTLEAGVYWLFYAIDTSAGGITFNGCELALGLNTNFVGANSGGVTVPASLAGLSQASGISAVPFVAVSVG